MNQFMNTVPLSFGSPARKLPSASLPSDSLSASRPGQPPSLLRGDTYSSSSQPLQLYAYLFPTIIYADGFVKGLSALSLRKIQCKNSAGNLAEIQRGFSGDPENPVPGNLRHKKISRKIAESQKTQKRKVKLPRRFKKQSLF